MNAQPTPDRRAIPRLTGTGRAYAIGAWHAGRAVKMHGITDGTETVYFDTKTEAVLAAKVHNLIHHHEN